MSDFLVQGLWFKVMGSRVQGCKACGLSIELRVQGFKGSKSSRPHVSCQDLSAKFRVQGFKGSRVQGFKGSRVQISCFRVKE